ncbi:proprotein convertase P-domain-containing protein [Streptomyces sp. NPDC093595]|uniref:proprotein convertase P-domain-containing protein n=1 Tax=Streptomyces sp. NPDC093595 TaxID=3366045 RepID=UPI00380005D6
MRESMHYRKWAALAMSPLLAVAGLTAVTASPTAAAQAASQKVFIQLGDSFASGEGAGWNANTDSNQNAGQANRQGTDVAARYDSSSQKWVYHPETSVYQADTYRELNGWWGSNPCHRAYKAPITHVKGYFDKALNLACSGAQSKHIWPYSAGGKDQHSGVAPQLEQLKEAISPTDDVQLVAIGVGGNDIKIPAYEKPGFGALVVGCIEAFVHTYYQDGYGERRCRDDIEPGAGDAVSEVFYNQLKTIDLVQQTLAAKGHPVGSYKLVLTGYPSITPTNFSDWSTGGEAGQWSDNCPVRRYDSSYINNHVVSRLNDVIQVAAEERGVGFINMEEAFEGHRLCEAETLRGSYAVSHPERAEWVRFLDVHDVNPVWEGAKSMLFGEESDEKKSKELNSQRSIAESFHPNALGQQALGTCLKTYYNDDPANSLQRCFVGGVGQRDTPESMVTSAIPKKTDVTDNPTGSVAVGAPLTRTVTVPDSVEAGHYFQWLPNITHPRKGHLRIHITAPDGTVFKMRDYNWSDTGAFSNGTSTRNYTGDPSGTWTLKIWDGDLSTHNGTLDRWTLKLF